MTTNTRRAPADIALALRLSPSGRNTVTGPGPFCRVLLEQQDYALPAHVNQETWMVALRYFADIDPVPDAFRRALERRSTEQGGRLEGGARVASYLLAQWNLYVKSWTQAQARHDSACRAGADELDDQYQFDDDDTYREIN